MRGLGRGLAWKLDQFERRFPDARSCADFLEKLQWPDGFQCPNERCGAKVRPRHLEPGRRLACPRCHYQTSPTANTLLDGLHTPLTAIFRSAWFLATNVDIKPVELQVELGLSSHRVARQLLMRWCWMMAQDLKAAQIDSNVMAPGKVAAKFRKAHEDLYFPEFVSHTVSSKAAFLLLLRLAVKTSGPIKQVQITEYFRSGSGDESPPESEEHK